MIHSGTIGRAKSTVKVQLPNNVLEAASFAAIQEVVLDRQKFQGSKTYSGKYNNSAGKGEQLYIATS
jgi:hypothetical protein